MRTRVTVFVDCCMLFQNDFPVDVEDHVFIDEARRSLVGLALHKWLGRGVTSGHYVSICKRGAKWFLFDDGAVECIGTFQDVRTLLAAQHNFQVYLATFVELSDAEADADSESRDGISSASTAIVEADAGPGSSGQVAVDSPLTGGPGACASGASNSATPPAVAQPRRSSSTKKVAFVCPPSGLSTYPAECDLSSPAVKKIAAAVAKVRLRLASPFRAVVVRTAHLESELYVL